MKYIPPFIIAKLRRGKLRGWLHACILVCELANPEQLAADFEAQGKQGAKEFARLLDALWLGPLDEIERRGGLIIGWYGDSLWALFPQAGPREVVAALNALRKMFRQTVLERENQAGPTPRVNLLLGWGRMNWQIFANQLQHEYTFFGREKDALESLPRGGKQVLLTPAASAKLGTAGLLDKQGDPARGIHMEALSLPQPPLETDHSLRNLFEHPRFRHLEPAPAFCQVVCNRIKLPRKDHSDPGQLIQDKELLGITFGALVPGIRINGSEFSGLVWFGVPGKDPKAAQKACRAALEARKKFPGIRHGIALGKVFAGMVGGERHSLYAVLGQVADRAGELCDLAAAGEVITDRQVQARLSNQFKFLPLAVSAPERESGAPALYKLAGLPSLQRSKGVFVGRKKELADLKTLIRQSLKRGNNLCVHICGTPGIGKTRLSEELIASLKNDAVNVFKLWCDPDQPPLDLLSQLLKQLFPISEDPARAGEEFSALWQNWAGKDTDLRSHKAFIGNLLGLHWPGSELELTPPELRVARIMDSCALVLREAASRQPLLIQIDDLQWIDGHSREIFERLGQAGIRRTCIMATSRYLEDGSVPELRAENFTSHRLDLGPLNRQDTLDLHKTLLGVEALPPATVEIINQKSDGNPFLVEQVIALCLELGLVNARGELDLPEDWEKYGLTDILLLRIDRLAAKTRACLFNASVLGMRFNVRVLSRMLNSDPRRELAGGAQNHIWQDLGEVLYIFSHVLIQEAAYARIQGKELPRLHLSAAQAMEYVFELELDEHAAEIAQHYEKAGHRAKAAAYYDRAADHAWDSSFLDRAETLYSRAVALSAAAEGKTSANHCEYTFHLALLYHYMLRHKEAEPLYLEVRRLARRIHGEGSPALSPYLNNLGRFYKDTGRFAEGEKLLRRSLAMEREMNPVSSNVADRINNLGHMHGIRKQFDQAEKLFLEALEIMEKNYSPEHFFTGTLCGNLGGVYYQLGRLEEALPLLERAVEITRKNHGPDHPVTAIYLSNLAKVHLALKNFGQAETLFLKALENILGPFGELHPKTLVVVELLQALYTEMGDPAQAKFYSRWLCRGKPVDV